MAIALLVAVAVLVLKPWAGGGEVGPASGGAAPGANGQATISATASAEPASASPDLFGAGSGPGATPTSPSTDLLANLHPIEPAAWSRISASLRLIDRSAVVFVERSAGGLYSRFVPVDPSGEEMTFAPPNDLGSTASPSAVRIAGYVATLVAIGLARPSGEPAPDVLAWQILGPGASLRLPLRHPVGDRDRFLFLGPGLGMPPGEELNLRELSRSPPVWLAGVYRFDLTATDGLTRHVFVVLDPGDSG